MWSRPDSDELRLDVPEPAVGLGRTTTAEALLGLLSMCPMSGYDLRALMARSTANFWQESFGQIYPALRKLVAAGLAEMDEEQAAGKRLRKVYRLTEAGRERLAEWLAKPCERQTIRDELLLKLFFGAEARAADLLDHVRRRRAEYAADLERYRALEVWIPEAQAGRAGLPFFLITLRKGLLDAEAQIRWCDETMTTLQAMLTPGHGSWKDEKDKEAV